MRRLLVRRFHVEADSARTWDVVADAERWPRWARHLRRVDLTPPGLVGPDTTALLRLTNGTRARVAVTEFVDGRRFRWDGSFLWLDLGYDHVVEPVGAGGSEVTFAVEADGRGVSVLGPLFARIYARNLDRGIPRLQRMLRADGSEADA